MTNSLIKVLLLATPVYFSTAQAAQPCNADRAVEAFTQSAKSALSELPALDKDVDKCFNASEHPEYLDTTHKTLRALSSQYKSAVKNLAQAYDSLATGRDQEFAQAVKQIVAKTEQAAKPLFDNASNLKRYGFTTSDREENGRPKYPECNSRNNDQPDERFARVFKSAQGVRKAGEALLKVAACLP